MKLGILGVQTKVYQWQSKNTQPGAQIDLVIDRKNDTVNICEINYSKDKYSITSTYEYELNNKINAFLLETNTKQSIQLTMITTEGLLHNTHSEAVTNEIILDNLFTAPL